MNDAFNSVLLQLQKNLFGASNVIRMSESRPVIGINVMHTYL